MLLLMGCVTTETSSASLSLRVLVYKRKSFQLASFASLIKYTKTQQLEKKKKNLHSYFGTSLVVQWLMNPSCNAGDMGSILGWVTKIPHAMEQQSPCISTAEPTAWQLESLCTAVKDAKGYKKDPRQPNK